MAAPRSAASSSPAHSRPASAHGGTESPVPVETLVQHLLDAKRSLSSMTLVLRANELVTFARHSLEESTILSAQSQFLRQGISAQVRLLLRVRKSMNKAYEAGKREFKQVIKTLDSTNGRLEDATSVLRGRVVESAFRPKGEERRNLLDFVDEKQLETMRDALKENIGALQATQTSFDGDLLRFDTDLRTLNKAMSSGPSAPSPSASSSGQSIPHLLSSILGNSHAMAELLASLTKHFDLCVTAVRTTEGGAALARRKAAEATQLQGGDDVSISGVIAEQESHPADLEPISAEERAQMLEVVVQDSGEVGDVVRELNERLQTMEAEFNSLDEQACLIKQRYTVTIDAFRVLEDIASRLQSYIAAEAEFRDRWADEQETIRGKMVEMEELKSFYEMYASAYDELILEVERRNRVEERVLAIWRRAKESVDKIIENDRKEREIVRQELGEYVPTDLWPGMDESMRRWEIVPMRDEGAHEDGQSLGSTPALDRSVVQAAAMRLGHASERR